MLKVAEAVRHLFPVEKIKKNGETTTQWIPGGYGITLSDGHHVSVTSRKVPTGTDDGKVVYRKGLYVSVHAPKTPIHNCLGTVVGEEEKRKVVFACSPWAKFVEEYQRCGMPTLVEEGMIQADIELEARRQAGRAAA